MLGLMIGDALDHYSCDKYGKTNNFFGTYYCTEVAE